MGEAHVRGGPPVPARPRLGWSDLVGPAVGLWGVGVEGAASLRRLRTLGVVPVLVDDRPAAPELGRLPVLTTSHGGLDALARCEVVVKAPGISRYRPEAVELVSNGVALVGGLGLWLEEAPRHRVVCVTGTKGKSTTAAVCRHLLAGLGYRCLLGGNIGRPPWDPAAGTDHDFWVVETSSFQATDLGTSPAVVAVTSLAPDHLDWHGDVETYYRDKLSACSQPGAALTVADGTSAPLRARSQLLGPKVRWVGDTDGELDGPWIDGLGLEGTHNRRNAMIARACLSGLGVAEAAGDDALCRAARGFSGLDSRLRHIGTVGGVSFVDDSLSTNVLPALAALATFRDRPVALLAGGHDRGIDYAPLARALADRAARTLVLTLPASGLRIHDAIDAVDGDLGGSGRGRKDPGRDRGVGVAGAAGTEGSGGARRRVEVVDCQDVTSATVAAFRWARPDGVVLLSPAAPSFGQFRDYRDRAAVFAQAMRACATAGSEATPAG